VNEDYPTSDEFYFSMSRDVPDKERERGRVSFHWWEIPIYLLLLVIMFAVSRTMFR